MREIHSRLQEAMRGQPLDLDPLDLDPEFESERNVGMENEGIPGIVAESRKRFTHQNSAKSVSAVARYTHLMQFNVSSGSFIIERDCICDFWKKLDYKF